MLLETRGNFPHWGPDGSRWEESSQSEEGIAYLLYTFRVFLINFGIYLHIWGFFICLNLERNIFSCQKLCLLSSEDDSSTGSSRATSPAASHPTGFIQVLYSWRGEHVCFVNMALRFILQVFRDWTKTWTSVKGSHKHSVEDCLLVHIRIVWFVYKTYILLVTAGVLALGINLVK